MIRDVTLSLVTRVVTISAGVLVSILTARALGVRGQGEYYYIVTLALLATQFGNLGMASSNTYSLARDHALLPRLAANSFWISLVVGVVTAGALIAFEIGRTGAGASVTPVWLLILMVPTMLYMLLGSNLLIGLSLIRDYSFFQLGSSTFQLAAIAAAAWVGGGVAAFVAVSAVTGVLASIALAAMIRRLHRLDWRFDWALFRSNLAYAGRAYLATLFGFCVSRAGVLLLDRYAGKAEIGIYSIALQFADALIIVPTTVAMVLFPTLLRGPSEKRFLQTMKTAVQIALLMTVLCLLTAFVAFWLIPVLFGKAFASAVEVLWWMLPGVLAFSLTTIVSQYLASRGIPLANVLVWLAGLVLLLASGIVLIPRWGSLGAAACLSLAYIFVAVALTILAFRHSALEARA